MYNMTNDNMERNFIDANSNISKDNISKFKPQLLVVENWKHYFVVSYAKYVNNKKHGRILSICPGGARRFDSYINAMKYAHMLNMPCKELNF